jgi:hypothetical protein
MKTLKNLFALFVMGALVLVACEKKGPAIVEAEPSDFPEIMPTLNAPSKDSVTIAVYVPSNTCNGLVLVGAGVGPNGTDDWGPGDKKNPFKQVDPELANGEDRWYSITIAFNDALGVKAIALTKDGVADWATQWGKNTDDDENVVLLQGLATIDNSENDGEVKLKPTEAGSIVFVGIKAWKAAPCVERNKAGKALFTAKVEDSFPAEAILGVVGKINADQNWNNDNPLLLTKGEGNVWTLEAEVFDACEYKYRASLDGGANWIWPNEGDNIQMVLDLNPVDAPTFTFPVADQPAQ